MFSIRFVHIKKILKFAKMKIYVCLQIKQSNKSKIWPQKCNFGFHRFKNDSVRILTLNIIRKAKINVLNLTYPFKSEDFYI